MSRVLVVEDSPTQARAISFQLTDAGFDVQTAGDGLEALEKIVEAIESDEPVPFEAIITDLEMPRMTGLELVEAVRRHCPALPVIVITAHGSEEIAVEALEKGASSYIPKRILSQDIIPTLNNILAVAPGKLQQQRLIDCLTQVESRYSLDNDPLLVTALINQFCDTLRQMRLWDETNNIRFGVALREALNNAIYHGNLGLNSDLRENDDRQFYDLADKRRHEDPYRRRKVHVTARVTTGEAVCVVRDEGEGFNVAALPDPTDPRNIERASGRGLMLIRTFMDDVRFNPAGNEISMTMLKAGTVGA